MERDFEIIHYKNPPLTPPKRGIHGVPLERGKGWVVSSLIAMKICCQDLQKIGNAPSKLNIIKFLWKLHISQVNTPIKLKKYSYYPNTIYDLRFKSYLVHRKS